jgi:hypothetical protein
MMSKGAIMCKYIVGFLAAWFLGGFAYAADAERLSGILELSWDLSPDCIKWPCHKDLKARLLISFSLRLLKG